MPPAKKTDTPVPPTLYSLTLLNTKRLGHPEFTLAVVKTVGDKVASVTALPDGNWDTIDGALRDLHNAAIQGFRFRNWEALLAGRA